MNSFANQLPIVVVGAGAAGLVAAIFAARSGRRTLLLERTRDGGRKILISGGGRCNVLPSAMRPDRYTTASSPNTLKKMLRSWPLPEQQRFFEGQVGVKLVMEPETGKLFPESNRARDVRDGLVRLAMGAGAEIRFEQRVADVEPLENGTWRIVLEGEAPIHAAAVVIATGGLSVPSTGSDGTGLRIARRLGHEVHELYPALTPLTATPPLHAELAGVSLTVRIAVPRGGPHGNATGGFLFTHRGYSGPSVLDVSHFAVRSRMQGNASQPLLVQWTPWTAEQWEQTLLDAGAGEAGPLLRRHLPTRLADRLLEEAGVPADRSLARLRRGERLRLVELLARYPLPWTGDEGYKKAEVTGGGVALNEVDPKGLQSRRCPGLFFCGEVLDAFGPIGGYNFLWAWATGRAAGTGAASLLSTA